VPTQQETLVTTTVFAEALVRAANARGPATRAATHLLIASQLNLIDAVERGWIQLTKQPAGLHAKVVNWSEMIFTHRPGNNQNLLKLAHCFDGYTHVDLAKLGQGLHGWQVRVVAEAILINADLTSWLVVAPTPDAPDQLKVGYATGILSPYTGNQQDEQVGGGSGR
jgi:hypothetical protein